MIKFKQGQEVEVTEGKGVWRKGKIAEIVGYMEPYHHWQVVVEFPGGSFTMADAEHIRDYDITRNKGWDMYEGERIPATD